MPSSILLIQPKLGHERQLSVFGLKTLRQPRKSLFKPNLLSGMCDFFPCCRTRVICCLCHFKSGELFEGGGGGGWSGGGLHDGNCHHCPIDGCCQYPANPQSNPTIPQQRNQTHQGGRDGVLQQHSVTHTSRRTQLEEPLYMKIGSHAWLMTELMFTTFGQITKKNAQSGWGLFCWFVHFERNWVTVSGSNLGGVWLRFMTYGFLHLTRTLFI